MESLLEKFLLCSGVSTDSRIIKPGQMFFAIRGENFNGNLFASRALDEGALFAVVDDPSVCRDDRYILVENVLSGLQELARQYRQKLKIPFVGITGSNGKTTTKELFASVLSGKFRTLATEGNLNNHIGVPLTLLKIKPEHQLAIIEMGASGKGEIELLAGISCPDIGIITNVGAAHLEGFGSLEGVMIAKSELYRFLDDHGGKVLFPESLHKKPYFIQMKKAEWMDYTAVDMKGDQVKAVSLKNDFPFLTIEIITIGGRKIEVDTQLYGNYNFANLVNAIKIGDYFGLEPELIAEGIRRYIPRSNRSQMVRDTNNGNDIIMDAYNANPSSMAEALRHFISVRHEGEKLVILGDMLELGADSVAEHEKVIKWVSEQKDLEAVFVGTEFGAAKKSLGLELPELHFFTDTLEAKEFVEQKNAKQLMILVKGSRGIALERIFPGIFARS